MATLSFEDPWTEAGDESSQLASWTFTAATALNTNMGQLYVSLSNSGSTRTVDVYKTSARASGDKVATGNRSGDGSITLSQANSSGLSGTVSVTYTTDDSDITLAGHPVATHEERWLELSLINSSKFRTWTGAADTTAAKAFVHHMGALTANITRPFALIGEDEDDERSFTKIASGAFADAGTLVLHLEAATAEGEHPGTGTLAFKADVIEILDDILSQAEDGDRLRVHRLEKIGGPRAMPFDRKAGEADGIGDTSVFVYVFRVHWGSQDL